MPGRSRAASRASRRPLSVVGNIGRALAVFTLLAAEVGPLTPPTLADPRDSGASAGSPSLGTGGPVAPIDYKFPDDGASAGGGGSAVDPSVARAPAFVRLQRPRTKTAVQADWSADRSVWANPDGSFTAEVGAGINYRPAGGEWTPIDLSLVETKDGAFAPRAAPSSVTLTTAAADGTLAVLNGDSATISLRSLLSRTGSKAADQLVFTAGAAEPSIFVRPTDTGFEFGATFDEPTSVPFIELLLDAGGLTAKLGKDGLSIDLIDPKAKPGEALVGSIGAPALIDAKGAEGSAKDVTVGLTDQGDGTYLLAYFVAPTWLSALDRAFPVTLDPTVCVRNGDTACAVSTNVVDIWYGSGQPGTYVTNSLTSYTHVGKYVATSDPWGQTRAALFFPGVSLPDGAVITGADLRLREVNNYSGATVARIYARMIDKSTGWSLNNSSVTWNSLAAAVRTGYDSPQVPPCDSGGTNCDLHLDVTAAVRAWYTRRGQDWKPNAGFQVRYATEGSTSNYYETTFYRYNEQGNFPTRRPKLTITYELGGFGINFDAALGPTYAPSAMVAGQATVLPVKITDKGAVALDTTSYRAGYRFLNVKGAVVSSGVGTLPATINPGTTSAVFGLTVTPPATPGQYTLRLDVVKVVGGVNVFYSDWAKPTSFYSRNKNILTSDSTRWTGSSVMERDEFGINVVNGQGDRGDIKTVTTGDGGNVGINLWSKNLSYDGDTGISVDDRIPLSLTYGYNSKDAATCSGYRGILGACGWYTNWDERVIAGATDDSFTYYSPNGDAYLTDSDFDGQLVGAPNQLSRKRVTLFDENRPTSGAATLVSAASEGIPTISGPNVLKVGSNTTTVLGGFVDGAATREVSLSAYRSVNFSMRTGGATPATGTALCFLIDNKTQGIQRTMCAIAGAQFNTGYDTVWVTPDTVANNWSNHTVDLWGLVSGTFGGWTQYGKKTDDYFLKSVTILSSSPSNTGSTYLDRLELTPFSPWRIDVTGNITNWTSGSSTYTTAESISSNFGAVKLTGPVTCTTTDACFSSYGSTETINGQTWASLGPLTSAPFLSWWWKKAGGTSAALTVCVTDDRTAAKGEVTYYAGATAPSTVTDCPTLGASDRHFVQVGPHVPGHYARVIRNVLEDARQILNFYLDDETGATSATPPTNGPSADVVDWTGLTIDPVDGQYLLTTRVELNSTPLPSGLNRYADWSANKDDLNYAGIIDATDGPKDDFVAENPDGTFHFFNRDGLLTRIVTKQGAELDLEWTYAGSGTGPGAYTLVAVHAPSDNTDDGGATTYRHYLAVARTTPTGFTQTTFTEKLGTVAAPVTGRRADFYVATTTGSTWGISDLVKVSPARHNLASCGAAPSGCTEFRYTSTTSHLLNVAGDPRWDGTGGGASLGVTWSGSDPMAVTDGSHASAALLTVNTFDRGRTASPKYLRPLWQDAAAAAAGFAMHEDLSPDGSVAVEYIRQGPCASNNCTTNPPPGSDVTNDLAGRRAREYGFDGINHISSVTTYRCPGVAVGGCTGTTALASTTRRGTNAGAKVENYIDALTAGETAWEQSADQYFASLRDSGGTNPDLYRTEYTYNAVNAPIVVRQPVFNRLTDYPGALKSTEGLTHYWRLGEAASPFADSIGSSSGTGTSVTAGQPGALARDTNTAISLNGTSSRVTSAATLGSTAYTLEGWVNVTSADTNDKGFFGRYGSNAGALVYLRGYDGTLALAHNAQRVYSSAKIQPLRWYYVAATWDGAHAYLYLDGDLVGTDTVAGAPGDGSGTFEIGAYGNGAANTFLNGQVDEVATRSVAVDQSKLRAEYQAGRGVAMIRTETTYGSHGTMTNWTHLDADPTQQAVQLVANGDFEEGLSGWNANHGMVLTDPATVTASSGAEAIALTGSNYTEQVVQAVPGQRIHLQLSGKVSGGALLGYRVEYWIPSSGTWASLGGEYTIGTAGWSTAAVQRNVPGPLNTTGLLKVTLRDQNALGTAYADAVLLIADWHAWDYKAPSQSYHGGSGRNAYIGDSLVEYRKSFKPSSSGGTRLDRLYYDIESGHAAIWPRRTVANYVDGTPGPTADEDVTTTTTFDVWGRPLSVTDPDGVATTTSFDGTNQTDIVSTRLGSLGPTTYAYDGVGNRTLTTTPLGRVSSAAFDYRNQQTSTTQPDGVVAKTVYDNYGRVSATYANNVDDNPATGDGTDDVLTTFAYDASGRVIQQDAECGSVGACATGGLDARSTTSYDLLGNAVATTIFPNSNGGGTPRVTTNYFETTGPFGGTTYSRTGASGLRLAIAPTASPAPLCPGTTATYCNTASVWHLNNATLSATDMNGRSFATTDAYGIVTLTDYDLSGRPVVVTAGYAAGPGYDSDTNVTTGTYYNLNGAPVEKYFPLGPFDDFGLDSLGRVTSVYHYDRFGVFFKQEATQYLPSGRILQTFDGSAWTRTAYDDAGRAVRTVANYNNASSTAGMTVDAVEAANRVEVGSANPPLTGLWHNTTTTFVPAAPAGLTTDTDTFGNAYDAMAPASGHGRLRVTTSAGAANSGTWFDLSGPTYQAGHTYQAAFDLATSTAGLQVTASLGQDQGGGSFGTLSIPATTTTWSRYTVSWTAGASLSSPIHFAIVKTTAGTAQLYLDNLVVWDSTAGWTDSGIVSSATAYNDDSEITASVLPPGDPATERPLVTTVAFDPAGRSVITTVNGTSGAYAGTVVGTANLAAYVPLDERVPGNVADKVAGATPLSRTGTPRYGVAGALDEARTGLALSPGAYLSRTTNATSSTTNVSMEAWLRIEPGSLPSQTLVAVANGTATNGWGIGLDTAARAAGFVISGSTLTTMSASASAALNDGRWHHLILTRGASVWAMTLDGSSQTLTSNASSPGTPGAGFSIGALADGTRALAADVDEVSVYTADISGSTAASHWAAGRRTDAVTALTSRTAFDRLGRATDTWAPDLVRTKAVYDRLGHQTATTLNYRDGTTTGGTADDDVTSTFAYDVLGEQTGYCPAVQVKAGGCDPTSASNAQAWHYVFDDLGRQVKTIRPVNSIATALATSETVYEAGGHTAQTCTYPAGGTCGTYNSRHVDFTYDDLGRILTQKTWDRAASPAADTLKFTKTLTWNADSTPASVAEGATTLNYVYDGAGRPSQFKNGSTQLTAWTYTPSTSTVATRTDGAANTTSFGYDWARRTTSVTATAGTFAGIGTVSRTYRLDGTLATQAFPASITETLAYDAVKRPISIGLGSAGSLSQAFDRAGRVISEGRTLTGITGDAGTGSQSFFYDNLSRLGSSSGPSTTSRTYQYDLDGNRTRRVQNSTTTDFTYDRADTATNQTIAGTTRTFSYDQYGNLVQAPDTTSAYSSYNYDEANRLTSITPPTGGQVTFTVDPLDRHATRAVGGTTSDTYGYIGPAETAWQTGAATTTSALLDNDGSRLAVKTGTGGVAWLIFDLHGSAVALCTAGTTTLSDAYRYDGYGERIAASGASLNPWQYRGLLNIGSDALTWALLDMGARDYSPQLGQFTQADPVQGQAANPLSMNRFLYALANPATLIDPDGHKATECDSGCGSDHPIEPPTCQEMGTCGHAHRPAPKRTGGGGGGGGSPATQADCDRGCATHQGEPPRMTVSEFDKWYWSLSFSARQNFDRSGLGAQARCGATADGRSDGWCQFLGLFSNVFGDPPNPNYPKNLTIGIVPFGFGGGGALAEAPGAEGVGANVASGGRTAAIGKFLTGDTLAAQELGYEILSVPKADWSIGLNRGWIKGLARDRVPVYVGSPTTWKNLWDVAKGEPSPFGWEIRWLTEDHGYIWNGWTLMPPG